MRGTYPQPCKDERGYTLPEVLTAVAIAGVLATIAVIIFLALLERWRVEAAADQLASDMRLAHTRATQQLTDWRLVMTAGSPEYALTRLKNVYEGGGSAGAPEAAETRERALPAGTMAYSSTAHREATAPDTGREFYVEFNADGTIHVPNGPNGNIRVSSDDTSPRCRITYLSATSIVKLGPLAYQ